MNPPQKNPKQILEMMIKDRGFRIAMARQNHYWFFHFYFAHYVLYPTADFQRDIFALTERSDNGMTVICSFRGSAKSTICTLSYPLWAILGKEQKKFVVLLSQTQRQARQLLTNIKSELEKNAILRNDLGPFKEETDEWGGYSLVIPRYNARITAASSEQSIRGIRHLQHRPDVIIADDVEDLPSVRTKESRDKTNEWFRGDVLPAGARETKTIVVGNLLHEDSLLKRLKKEIKNGTLTGTYREYPVIKADGSSMWPGKFPTLEAIQDARNRLSNESAWQREFLLRIISSDEQIIRPEWIQRYEAIPSFSGNDFRYTATGIDLAISQKATADYTAMVSGHIFGRGKEMRIYILPNPINGRMDFPATMETAKSLSKSLGYGKQTELFIEDVGYQRALVQDLQQQGWPAKGVPVQGQDKASRLRLTSYLIQSGHILFPHKGCEDLITQLTGFPSESHDDLADAFAILVLKAIELNPRFRTMMIIDKVDRI